MRTVDPGLRAHLDMGVTTLCSCWLLTRRDGVVLGFTDHDDTLSLLGVACEPTSGLRATEAVSSLGLPADTQDVEGVFSSEAVTASDLDAGRYDGARIAVYLVNWADPSQHFRQRTALLGEVVREDDVFRVELRGLTSLLDRPNGRRFSRSCDAELGDARCRVATGEPVFSPGSHVQAVVAPDAIRIARPDGYPADWFSQGQLLWLTGTNAGITTPLASGALRADNVLRLWREPPHAVAVGDTFRLTVGCDKRFSTCRQKFGNAINFQGFPHMPTEDFALSYATSTAVHDGAPLVP